MVVVVATAALVVVGRGIAAATEVALVAIAVVAIAVVVVGVVVVTEWTQMAVAIAVIRGSLIHCG